MKVAFAGAGYIIDIHAKAAQAQPGVELAAVVGRNSDRLAALALAGIERFPAQAKQREEMAAYMDEALSEVPGVRVLKRDPRHTTRSFYRYIFAIVPQTFGVEHDVLCAALDAEGVNCWVGYEAMHRYTLFQPRKSKLAVPSAFPHYFEFEKMDLPEATRACQHEAVWLDEAVFRAGQQGVDDAVRAIKKIQSHAGELAEAAQKLREKYER
ncbi:MAG: hypothetical protein Fur0043_22410 [Anaerolineales bacterium]